MNSQQAGMLIDRLMSAFDKQLKPDTASLYLEFLEKMPYERTRIAVEKCIEKERFFPSIGTIRQHAEGVTLEGQPNAAAYSQGGDSRPWWQNDDGAWTMFMNQKITDLAEEDYLRYTFDKSFASHMRNQWRKEFELTSRGETA